MLFPYLKQTDLLLGIHEVSFRNLAVLTGLHQHTLPKSIERLAVAGVVEVIGRTKGRNGGIAYRLKQNSTETSKKRMPMYYVKSHNASSDLNGQQIIWLKAEMLKDRYAGCHKLIEYKFLR